MMNETMKETLSDLFKLVEVSFCCSLCLVFSLLHFDFKLRAHTLEERK